MTRVPRVPDWDLADRLKKSLRESGIGAGEMAARLGVNRTTLSNWCNGTKTPSLATLRMWADETAVPVAWLIGDLARTVYVVWAPVRHMPGYRAVCECGWSSPTYAIGEHSIDAALAHWRRTPDHAFAAESRGRDARMSTVFGVEDDGTPRAALDIAGQAVRAFNRQTFSRPELGREGWQFASDQYSALGELTYMVGMLPQVFAQITAGLRSQLEAGALGVDQGTDGTPPEKVARAGAELQQASLHAQAMYQAIAAAQSAIAAVHNVDPVSAS